MTVVYETGAPQMAFDPGVAGGLGVNGLIDAAGEKFAVVGNVWHPTIKTGSIAIRKVHFRMGALTLNAASQVRVSLQVVSQTAGPPYQPDGVQQEFYDFKTATTSLVANAWNITGNLSADRTVNLASDSAGETNSRRLAIVWEYQVFTAADSAIVSALTATAYVSPTLAGVLLNTGGVWASVGNRVPMVALECSDGSMAFLTGSVPYITVTNTLATSTGAIRRAGVRFKVPTERVIDRIALSLRLQNGADGRLVLYDADGTTELASINLDNDDCLSTVSDSPFELPITPLTLLANTFYRLAFVATTATGGAVNYADMFSAAMQDGCIFGQSATWTQHDGTSWTEITTRRPFFALGVIGYEIPSATGLRVNGGMTGGIRG